MMHYLKSCLIQLSDKIHFITIFIILFCLSFYNQFNIILLLIYIVYLYKIRIFDKIFIVIIIIFSFIITIDYLRYNDNINIDNKYTIIENKDNRYLVSKGIHKYYIYTVNEYKIGDIVEIKGELEDIKKPSYDGDYNIKLNLFSKYIDGYIKIKSDKCVGHRFTLYKIRDNILNLYSNYITPNSYLYFSALTLAENNLDKESFIKLNLAHIIAISGFHIILIYNFIKKTLFNITHDLYNSDNIAIIVVIIYNILTGFSISVLKATIYLIIKRENEKYKYYTNLDLLSITFLIMMLRPRLIFNIGFILGFLSSFILIFINELIRTKNIYLKQIYQGIIMFLFLLPFISKMNNEVSILSIFSFLFFDIFSYFIIPYTFILFIIPSISYIVEPAIILINNILLTTSNIYNIYFPTMNDYIIYIYYIILYITFINHKLIIKTILSVFLLILIYLGSIITIDKVEFIDVGQGDCTLISISGNNILIDAHNCYNYLVKKGIYKIKYIFITHDDLDHLSDLEKIINNLDVDIVYTNKYSKEVVKICEKTNNECRLIGTGDVINVLNHKFNIIGPSYDHKDDNMNSLIIKYSDNYFSYLFTGDMTKENEYELLNKNIGQIDILKVAHHGSNTSSSKVFIDKIKPKYSIVSVGKNKFGLPDKNVISLLKMTSTLYITKENGNIMVYQGKIIGYK